MPNDSHLNALQNALQLYRQGVCPDIIELPEKAVFPHLITFSPATARKSRVTGLLGGRQAPKFIRRGRMIRYRLCDILQWLENQPSGHSTAYLSLISTSLLPKGTDKHHELNIY